MSFRVPAEKKEHSRVKILLSICLGNLLEHYDTALYAFLAPYLSTLLFPEKTPIAALISTYAIIPLSFIAKPLGAIVLGRVADTKGRVQALAMSLKGMGLVCLSVALMPTIPLFSSHAALCFCIARLLQSFFSAVEVSGGAIYLLERIDTPRKKLLGSLFSASTIAGILLASLSVALLSMAADIKKAWPLLYLGGSLVAVVGLFLRKDTKELLLPRERNTEPFWRGLRCYVAPMLMIAMLSGLSYAHYCVCFLFPTAAAVSILGIESKAVEIMNTLLLCLDLLLLPLFASFLEKKSSRKSLIILSLISAVATCPLIFFLMQGASYSFIAARLGFVLIGTAFEAPLYALFQGLIPKDKRFTGVGLASAIGSKAIGAPAMPALLYTLDKTGSPFYCGLYVSVLALLCALALIMAWQKVSAREEIPG
jgi:MHS family proline/betaine transporter-like MFS transporter